VLKSRHKVQGKTFDLDIKPEFMYEHQPV